MIQYVALVCRLSPRSDREYEGVDLQERWGRAYAAEKWPGVPIEVFADRGISAAGDDHRPEFERFREWLASGKIAHVWAVEQKRVERREVEWFRLAGEMEAAGVDELHTNRDGVVQVRGALAGIKAVLGADEVRELKKRHRDRLNENAADGKPPGSKPFGYAHARNAEGVKTYVVIPEQAEAIRQAAEWVLAGWSLANIARELRNRGLRGAHGGEISAAAVRSFLTSRTITGVRVYQGRVVGPGNWPAIIDEQTSQAVRLKLSQPRRVTRSDGRTHEITLKVVPTGRRYLLTGGLAVCGVCEAPLRATVKQLRHGNRPYYECSKQKRRPNGDPACGGIGIVGLPLEAHVVDRLFAELDKPAFLDAIAADDHGARRDRLTAALEDVERQRNELAAEWATPGALTMSEWQTARRGLSQQEHQLRRDLADVPPPVLNVDIAAVREAWPDMLLDEQREFVRLYIETVRIKRARPGLKAFDGERAEIDWRNR
ncbi:recombinase family protein [Amycolatopsis sp. CA-126428]|uniref:recombinase family protein n=1 Tax=Amycolatopsis sp. CA-126428 TaxID=2073158 RepID=UPI000CD287A8|nr:recombinase family protein [Amycolatopsis sp. CA-126428]